MASFPPISTGTSSDVLDDTGTHGYLTTFSKIRLGKRSSTAPKAMTQTNAIKCCKFKCHFPIFLPYGRFQQIWSGFLLILVIYSIIETPVVISFELKSPGKEIIEWVAFVVDICMICDIFINFRTAYIDKYDRLRIIHEPKLIAKRYLKKWFWIDLLASFPSSIIVIYGGNHIRILKVLRLVRIVKLFKVFQVNYLNYSTQQLFKLVKILCLMLLTCHYFACFWYFIGGIGCNRYNACWLSYIEEQEELELDKITNFTKYTYSAYWAAVSLFTTGYGDIHAWNVLEMWISILCLLIGCIFFAYFLSVFTSWKTDDKLKQYEIDKVEKTIIFCAHYNLPLEIRRALVTHVRYACSYNYVFDQSQILDFLPPYLQKTVQKYLAQRILSQLDLFQSLTDDVIGQLVLKLKSRSCNIGHLLFERGENGRELYIQRTGQSRLMNKGDPRRFKPLKRGDICGENIVISRKRIHSVQCETWSEFYVLDMEDILTVLKANYGPINARKEWIKIKEIALETQSDWDGSPRHCNMPTPILDPIFVAPGLHDTFMDLSEESVLLMQHEVECNTENQLKQKRPLGFRSMQELFNFRSSQSNVIMNESIQKQNDAKTALTEEDGSESMSEKELKLRKPPAMRSLQNLFKIKQTSDERDKRNVSSQNRQSKDLVIGFGFGNEYNYEFVDDGGDDGFDESFELSSAGFGQQHGLYTTWSKIEMAKFKKISNKLEKNDKDLYISNRPDDNDDRKEKELSAVVDDKKYKLDVSGLDKKIYSSEQSKRNKDPDNVESESDDLSVHFMNNRRMTA